MAIIAVDMDDVLAETLDKIIRVYNQRLGQTLTRESLNGKHFREMLLGQHLAEVRQWLLEPDFFADLEVKPWAKECLRDLVDEHTVFIASAAMEFPTSFAAKFSWLERHFPFIPPSNIVFCGDKSIIRADYLIDDQPRYLKAFKGHGILFEAPHNQGENGFTRVGSWHDVDRFFAGLKGSTSLKFGTP